MRMMQTVLTAVALIAVPSAYAADAAALAQQKACLSCHAVDHKVVGPAFRDVAKKYKGNAAAVGTLAAKVRKGGAGVWGNIPMPPNNVTDAEARVLVQWVLAQ